MGINGSFRFHSVGQGLFYSGILHQKDSSGQYTFSLVYDCGTESPREFLKREIADLKLLLPEAKGRKKLDLLVVSHLHDDHINGLEELLQHVDVSTVVMPYADEGLRLLAQLESCGEEAFLRAFYADPVGWFVSKGVHRILLLGAEERVSEADRGQVIQYIGDDLLFADPGSILRMERDGETEIGYLKHSAHLRCPCCGWEFLFENLSWDTTKTTQYIDVVEQFKKSRLTTLEQILKSRRLSMELGRELRAVFPSGDAVNRTSVVMLHHPVSTDVQAFWNSYDLYYTRQLSGKTVLTGDLRLKETEVLSILPPRKDSYLVLQYPHHGSGRNRLDYFVDLCADLNIVSYGLVNRYGHPDSTVLNHLRLLVAVTERHAFDYQISVP